MLSCCYNPNTNDDDDNNADDNFSDNPFSRSPTPVKDSVKDTEI